MSTFIPSRTAGSRARVALVLLGSLAGVMAAGAAGAATPDSDVRSVVVKFGDLTLDTDSGVNQLYRRIVFAASRVCPDDGMRDLMAHQRIEQCRKQAIARAIQQIDNPRLAALHAVRSKSG
jgi:UrcA family protein